MSNNLASADPSSLPYYVATYKGRSVAIKRDTKYETTIKLVQKSIPKLRTADIQDIFISTTLSDYGGALVQLSEEIWPDVVSHVKTVEITLEGDDDTASEPINMRPGSVTWTARPENAGTATATTNQNVQDLPTPIASRQPFSDPANTSTDPQHSVSITIRTPSHTLLDLDDLPASTKIGDVKSLIEHKHGMPATLQRLNLLGNPLDDSATLAQSDITFPTIADLTIIARQCMIYLHPGTNQHNQFLSYQNVGVKFSLNRAWELAALHRSAEILSKDYTQSVSWTVDVATDGVLTEHGSGTKLSYLFWDGVAQPTQLAPPAPYPSPSQSAESSPTRRSQFAPLLDPRNSVAVPVGQVGPYFQHLFHNLNIGGSLPAQLMRFLPHLNKKHYKYLALRFIPQAECETMSPLSISAPTNKIIRIFVVYKGLTAAAAEIWDNSQPSYAQGAVIWKSIAGLTSGGWGVAGGCLNVVEISWMEVL